MCETYLLQLLKYVLVLVINFSAENTPELQENLFLIDD